MTSGRRRLLETTLEITVPILLLVIWGLWSSGSDTYYFPPLTSNAVYQASMLRSGPMTRNLAGECGFDAS